jgi:hypothetical protein
MFLENAQFTYYYKQREPKSINIQNQLQNILKISRIFIGCLFNIKFEIVVIVNTHYQTNL